MGGDCLIDTDKYSLLEDFNVDVEVEDEGFETFSLCVWVYLLNSTTFPSTIIRQVHQGMTVSAPFLVLDENKHMMLLPLTLLHKEAPDPVNTASWTEVPNVSTKSEFPLDKWVHVGCEISRNYMRLHINGDIEGEQSLSCLLPKDIINRECPGKISLFSVGGDGYSVQGFIQRAEVLPATCPVKYNYEKDPPLWLYVDCSSTSGIESYDDGVWNIVGGKASCRRIFSVDVVLSSAIGQLVHKNAEIVASLLYADSGTLVETTCDAEAPLLVRYDGLEFAASDRPSQLWNGRASFKLKISQLSSKSDNRLFCIKFEIVNVKGYPFLEAVTNPIRCISRSRDARSVPKRVNPFAYPLHAIPPLASSNESPYRLPFDVSSMKKLRLESDPLKIEDGNGTSMDWTAQDNEEENSSTESDSTEMRNPVYERYTITDTTIFQYCLGNMAERCLLLKEIASHSSEEKISEFADQVSLYSGCPHHGTQIKMARKLIDEGTNAWIMMARENGRVQWDSVVFEIEEQFMRIAQCSSRSLAQQDLEVLKRLSGCNDEYLSEENFEKMWCWLFPVASTIAQTVNGMWRSLSPKWIEGFITMEEAEHSLRGQESGTFILRFPTTRTWPHPDAGCLVVTYVSHDLSIRHRLLRMDLIPHSNEGYVDDQQLQDMLLAEPELSRLGRVIRSH